MPQLLTIRQVCERALRKIGAYAINDEGASAEEMTVAQEWLDLVVGHVTGRQRTWWLVPETVTISLTAGQTSYALGSTTLPGVDVQHAISVRARKLIDGRMEPIEISRREEWDARDTTQGAGEPQMVYVSREAPQPTLFIHPAPPDPLTHDLALTYQRFSTDMKAASVNTPLPDLRPTWNLYLITALAYELGNGPVRKLPGDEVKEMKDAAAVLLADLEAYDNHEQANEPRRTAFNDF